MSRLHAYLPLLVTGLACSMIWAHEVDSHPCSNSYSFEFQYDDGTPLALCDVTVLEPESDQVFVEGTTDRHGRFAFVPDKIGNWTLRVSDGMGHGKVQKLDILSLNAPMEPTESKLTRTQKLVTGLCVILGITGTVTLVLAKRERG